MVRDTRAIDKPEDLQLFQTSLTRCLCPNVAPYRLLFVEDCFEQDSLGANANEFYHSRSEAVLTLISLDGCCTVVSVKTARSSICSRLGQKLFRRSRMVDSRFG